ncbi:hypothetical protein MICAH_4400002 [Microcystis aeruginosa PCC 9809]|uniref:Uncharacterized protein n=1 Tax=Microcystis aeruginosa PCC 9809 TaxID=1160285 RepID=I4HZV5_MICAE|nr:hypothetical protein MICAH_4400002 [Microcystis aeruginosa PCC 9809]
MTAKLFQDIPFEKRKTFTCDKVKEFCGSHIQQVILNIFYLT